MSTKLKAGIAAVAVGALFMGVQGVGNAAPSETEFRLSNFHHSVVTVCVQSDVQTVCTGRIPSGTSRVYRIKYNDRNNFRCHANLDFAADLHSWQFDRDSYKECLTRSIDEYRARLIGKARGGHEAVIEQ